MTLTEWYMEYYTDGVEIEGRSITTASGAKITYLNNQVIYEQKDKTYITSVENGNIGNIELATTTNSQYYNSRHPELHTPYGFKYLEGTVDTGYVITDSQESDLSGGNEFVWIPVASSNIYSKKLGDHNLYVETDNPGHWKTAEQLNFDINNVTKGDILGTDKILGEDVIATLDNTASESKIVNSSGGFWVGRYEAGTASTSDANEIDWDNEIIYEKKGLQPVRYVTQEQTINLANNWKSGSSDENGGVAFQSGLITGTQWDTMCKFIGWDLCETTNSIVGNKSMIKSDLYTGYHSENASNTWIFENNVTKLTGTDYRWIFPTGNFLTYSGEEAKICNLYDVVGNVYEITAEVPCYGNREFVCRGMSAHDGMLFASARYGGNKSWMCGMRIVLYVK